MTESALPTFETIDAAVTALEQVLSSKGPIDQKEIRIIRAALSFLETKAAAREVSMDKGNEIADMLQPFVLSARTLLILALQGQQNSEGIDGIARFNTLLSALHGTHP